MSEGEIENQHSDSMRQLEKIMEIAHSFKDDPNFDVHIKVDYNNVIGDTVREKKFYESKGITLPEVRKLR